MMSRRSLKVFHEALIAQQINNLKQWIWAVMLASTIASDESVITWSKVIIIQSSYSTAVHLKLAMDEAQYTLPPNPLLYRGAKKLECMTNVNFPRKVRKTDSCSCPQLLKR